MKSRLKLTKLIYTSNTTEGSENIIAIIVRYLTLWITLAKNDRTRKIHTNLFWGQ